MESKNISFLNNFSKRMEKISIITVLSYRSFNKETFRNIGLDNYQKITNFMVAILLYAVEKTLTDDYFIFDDVQDFIECLISEHFNPSLKYSKEDYKSLTEMVINIFANTEEFISYDFNISSYSENLIYMRLIEDKIDTSISEKDAIYYVPNRILDFIFSTLEYNSYYAISVMEVKFEEGMKLQDYQKAYDQVKKMIQIERQHSRELKDFILRARENILDFYLKFNLKETIENSLTILNEHITKYKVMRSNTEKTINELARILEENEINDQTLIIKKYDDLKILNNMRTALDSLIMNQNTLLSDHLSLQNSIYSSLKDLITSRMDKKINLQKEFIDKLKGDLNSLDEFLMMINIFALPKSKYEKIFNLGKVIEEQKSIKESTKRNTGVKLLKPDTARKDEIMTNNIIKQNSYNLILKTLIDLLVEAKEISLSEIYDLDKRDSNSSLFSDVRKFSYVLLSLIRENGVIKEKIVTSQETEDITTGKIDRYRYEFNLKKAINELYKDEDIPFKSIKLKRLDNNPIIKIKGIKDADGIIEYFESSDYLFSVERGGIYA